MSITPGRQYYIAFWFGIFITEACDMSKYNIGPRRFPHKRSKFRSTCMRMHTHGALYAVNPEYDPNRTTWDATPLEARLQVI